MKSRPVAVQMLPPPSPLAPHSAGRFWVPPNHAQLFAVPAGVWFSQRAVLDKYEAKRAYEVPWNVGCMGAMGCVPLIH